MKTVQVDGIQLPCYLKDLKIEKVVLLDVLRADTSMALVVIRRLHWHWCWSLVLEGLGFKLIRGHVRARLEFQPKSFWLQNQTIRKEQEMWMHLDAAKFFLARVWLHLSSFSQTGALVYWVCASWGIPLTLG